MMLTHLEPALPFGSLPEDRGRLLLLLFAGEEKYREVFNSDPPSDALRLVKDMREFLGLFF